MAVISGRKREREREMRRRGQRGQQRKRGRHRKRKGEKRSSDRNRKTKSERERKKQRGEGERRQIRNWALILTPILSRCCLGPTPDSSKMWGDPTAPADRITSFLAFTWRREPWRMYSTPVAFPSLVNTCTKLFLGAKCWTMLNTSYLIFNYTAKVMLGRNPIHHYHEKNRIHCYHMIEPELKF